MDTKVDESVDRGETLPQSRDSNVSNRISQDDIRGLDRRESVFSMIHSRGSAIGSALESVTYDMLTELRPSVVPVQQVPVGSAKDAEVSGAFSGDRLNSIVEAYPLLDGARSSKWVCEDGIRRSGMCMCMYAIQQQKD